MRLIQKYVHTSTCYHHIVGMFGALVYDSDMSTASAFFKNQDLKRAEAVAAASSSSEKKDEVISLSLCSFIHLFIYSFHYSFHSCAIVRLDGVIQKYIV